MIRSSTVTKSNCRRNEWRIRQMANGRCYNCGKCPPIEGRKICSVCASKRGGHKKYGEGGMKTFSQIGAYVGMSGEMTRRTFNMAMSALRTGFEMLGVSNSEAEAVMHAKLALTRWTTLHHWTQFLTVAIDGWRHVDAEWVRSGE